MTPSRSVDLHIHSTASDGNLSPAEVVQRAAAAGVVGLSLTDHDTANGVEEARDEADLHGLRFLVGSELSANEPTRSVHLLAYGFDLEDEGFKAFAKHFRVARVERAQAIASKLQGMGIPLQYEDIQHYCDGAVPTRAHIGRALVGAGLVPDIPTVFRRYIGDGCPAHVRKPPTPPKLVFDMVHAAGGVVCLAHPGKVHSVEDVRRWAAEGLDGVEIRHPSNGPEVRSRMTAVADELGLLKSGGSDWHGSGMGRLGPGAEHVPERWMDAIIERTL